MHSKHRPLGIGKKTGKREEKTVYQQYPVDAKQIYGINVKERKRKGEKGKKSVEYIYI